MDFKLAYFYSGRNCFIFGFPDEGVRVPSVFEWGRALPCVLRPRKEVPWMVRMTKLEASPLPTVVFPFSSLSCMSTNPRRLSRGRGLSRQTCVWREWLDDWRGKCSSLKKIRGVNTLGFFLWRQCNWWCWYLLYRFDMPNALLKPQTWQNVAFVYSVKSGI